MADYIPFFGDSRAHSVEIDGEGNDISQLVHVQMLDLAQLNLAIRAITMVRNKREAQLGLSPEQFGMRQNVLLAARAVLLAERNSIIKQVKSTLLDAKS